MSVLLVTDEDVYEDLARAIRRAGSQKIYAEQVGLSESYVSDVVNKRRELSGAILGALGYARVYRYQRIT